MKRTLPLRNLVALAAIALASVAGTACTGTIGPRPGTSSAVPAGGNNGGGNNGVGGNNGAGGTTSLALVPGRSPLRRLTRIEYNNTVLALLGDTSQPALQFEPDTLADGFTNNADTQNVDTTLAQEYLGAAEALSATAIKNLNTLLGCDPTGNEDVCVRSFVTQFGQRAWRRPLTAPEIDSLAAVYTKGRADFDVPTSVQMVLQTILLSPGFLYRAEFGDPAAPATASTVPLTSWEMASRLSYFLIGSMPDAALFTAAQQDTLRTPAQVAAQAQRLLAANNPMAQDRMAQFFVEWMQVSSVDRMQKDVTVFPEFTMDLGAAFKEETQSFVKHTLFGGPGDLGTLLTAPYSYGPAAVANLYGLPPPTGGGDSRFDLDPSQRAGLLTQPAFLATFAKADTTEPVQRGKFVRESVLCGVVPAPPPNANITPPVVTPGTTARQRFTQHRSDPVCATCHALMDPIGLTMENFDGVGKWRDQEGGLPIDVSGELSGTDVDGPFVGAVALAKKLAGSDQVSACMVKQFFRFGFGRFETTDDDPTIQKLASQFQSNKRQILDLAVAMTQTPAFLQLQVVH
ncbi:MAG TPA: DUF1592 domain-containing protein [Polyangia bacterium]|jgi:hypothetical protein|nr:DUF1592 domain-containing protein [Polyangia bacterium]